METLEFTIIGYGKNSGKSKMHYKCSDMFFQRLKGDNRQAFDNREKYVLNAIWDFTNKLNDSNKPVQKMYVVFQSKMNEMN